MYWPWLTIDRITSPAVKTRRYGVIESSRNVFKAIHFRPFPKFSSHAEVWLDQWTRRWQKAEDHCWLYFNEPRSCPGYLSLVYIAANRGTSVATVQTALKMLDQVASIKRSEAIVCDASNLRLSERMLARYGFVPHAQKLGGRNFIKRFSHPPRYEWLRRSLTDIFPNVIGEERIATGEVVHT